MTELVNDMPSELLNAQAEVAIEVSNLYGFLANLYRSEISQEQIEKLQQPEMQIVLETVDIHLHGEFWSHPAEIVTNELAVEYAALFLGPGGHISPHESVHRDEQGLLWGDTTLAVRRFITESGIEYSSEYSGIPDHISVELEFLAELTRRESEAWLEGDMESVTNCLEYQCEFLNEHLGKWIGKFCSQIIDRAELSFYRDIAQLTEQFIASEIKAVDERIADAHSYAVSMEPGLAVEARA